MKYVYLHGWGSSPQSAKAQYFLDSFALHNIPLQIPDLNWPDFFSLTLSRQIQQLSHLLKQQEQVTIIGSSLGGLTALWLAEYLPQVQRLVLLAPALNFVANAKRQLRPEAYQQWQEQGWLTVQHYSRQQDCKLHYQFLENMLAYTDQNLQRPLPTLLFHGVFDEVIPLHDSQDFVTKRPWVDFFPLQDDHSLMSSLPKIMSEMQKGLYRTEII
ncbi:YqiA/YcfP family alpha/beta fold hydrolase [Candidatus Venteria ishoeyi]|uniref:YqiA/YcfP family alpha/beta fold hydrolase n=1 Tax=Candidatus Venteria ishoeyi TaxID=1899563 RepID=UPI0025A5524B|nr:YqiA/YcfP family alpha/beta fold hydrolase [Candidatus Venteria ishoeyi]MDM8548072.1 YqiA/YcfP family alpha/beta fold hydrolase [Candidatus Venteria ishoeyi]